MGEARTTKAHRASQLGSICSNCGVATTAEKLCTRCHATSVIVQSSAASHPLTRSAALPMRHRALPRPQATSTLPLSTLRKLRPSRAEVWAHYLTVMEAAGKAALDLADAIETYLRKSVAGGISVRSFHAACEAADRYWAAVKKAQPFHRAVITQCTSSHIINLENFELLAMMRELRGSMRSMVVGDPAGVRTAMLVPSEDGIAGFFALEMRSMQRFQAPRHIPSHPFI